jgi:hypothetical protein
MSWKDFSKSRLLATACPLNFQDREPTRIVSKKKKPIT